MNLEKGLGSGTWKKEKGLGSDEIGTRIGQ